MRVSSSTHFLSMWKGDRIHQDISGIWVDEKYVTNRGENPIATAETCKDLL